MGNLWGKEPDPVTSELKLRIESHNKNSNTTTFQYTTGLQVTAVRI